MISDKLISITLYVTSLTYISCHFYLFVISRLSVYLHLFSQSLKKSNIFKVPLKRNFFSRFLLFRTYEIPLQKDFGQKKLVMFFALQNVAFSTSER